MNKLTFLTLFALLLTCFAKLVPAAEPQIDQSTPAAVAKSFGHALLVGDADALRAIAIFPQGWDKKLIDNYQAFGAAKIRLIKAVTDKYGDGAQNQFPGLHEAPVPPGMIFKETGDVAELVDEKYPDMPSLGRFKKVNGKWKVDRATELDANALNQQLADDQKRIQITNSFADRVTHGEFKTASDAAKAYRDAMDSIFRDRQPSSSPASR